MRAAADALRQPPRERLVRRAARQEARREHAQAVGQALVERSGGEPRAGLDVAQRHNHNIRPRAGVLLRAHARVRRLDDRAGPGRAGARGRATALTTNCVVAAGPPFLASAPSCASPA